MQGRNQAVPQALSRLPRREDLEKLLKSAETSRGTVQQAVILGERKYMLRVQSGKSAGMGKAGKFADPYWSLSDGLNTLWQYHTFDLELIENVLNDSLSGPPSETTIGETEPGFPAGFGNRSDSRQFFSRTGVGADTNSQDGNVVASSGVTSTSGNALDSVFGQAAPELSRQASAGIQMSGNLGEMSAADLFQSISVGRMTGRLDLSCGLESLEVFFEEGTPRRASFRSDSMNSRVGELAGEEVILEALTWSNGFFQFNPSMKSSQRTPMRRLDMLLLEGAALVDYLKTVENAGFTQDSLPYHAAKVSEADFERALNEGVPVDLNLQKQFYISFDGTRSLEDVINLLDLNKPVWLPLMYNLVNCRLLAVKQVQVSNEEQSPLIKESGESGLQELLRADTGLISYPLMLHFVQVEFKRAVKLRQPVCLAVISVHKEGGGLVEQLSSDDLKLISRLMRENLEAFDHLGHYQILDLALLLPHRTAAQARRTVDEIIEKLDRQLAETGNQVRFVWNIGIGCVPENGLADDTLIRAAEADRKSPTQMR